MWLWIAQIILPSGWKSRFEVLARDGDMIWEPTAAAIRYSRRQPVSSYGDYIEYPWLASTVAGPTG